MKKKLEITTKLREQARTSKVNMFRSYRIGELPDIEIKNQEVFSFSFFFPPLFFEFKKLLNS